MAGCRGTHSQEGTRCVLVQNHEAVWWVCGLQTAMVQLWPMLNRPCHSVILSTYNTTAPASALPFCLFPSLESLSSGSTEGL